MKKTILISLLATSMLMGSCATIVSGSKQKVSFFSNPSYATVYINGVDVGTTPFMTKLKRNKNHEVMIKLDGYETYTVRLTKKFNGWYLGNIMLGGAIGFIIDPITGAMYNLSPKLTDAQLTKETSVKNDGKDVTITLSLDIDPSLQKVGQLVKS